MFKTRYKISWHYRGKKEVERLQKESKLQDESVLIARDWCFEVKKRFWFSPFWIGVEVFDDIRFAERHMDRMANPDIKKHGYKDSKKHVVLEY